MGEVESERQVVGRVERPEEREREKRNMPNVT